MHKIKEMLHKDSEDKHVSKDSHSHSHAHHDAHLSDDKFKHQHVHHGEIEHGRNLETTTVTREVVHEHGERRRSLDKAGEKHIYHERETLRDGGDLYRAGENPALHRDIVTETRHDGGVTRSHVDEAKIVKEKVKEVELHKVQPVVHRDREQKEIRHVVEPHQKFEMKDTKIEHLEKDIDLGTRREASTLETSRSIGGAPQIESSREFLGTERQHQELPTRVEEHVHKKVEEHIHPVIYKETLKPRVIEEVDHVYEKVREAPLETYEVRDLHVRDTGNLRDAERSFFDKQSARSIDIGSASAHTHSHGSTERVIETTHVHSANTMQQPLVGHHQNIGGHHLPSTVIEGGHNTAYDAALCNQCTKDPVCSHSEKDAALMQKMNEKKLAKDEKLRDKQHNVV